MIKRVKELTAAELKRATQIKERIEQLEKDLTSILGIPEAMTVGGTIRRHKKMSAAAGKKISQAAKARFGKAKTQQEE